MKAVAEVRVGHNSRLDQGGVSETGEKQVYSNTVEKFTVTLTQGAESGQRRTREPGEDYSLSLESGSWQIHPRHV